SPIGQPAAEAAALVGRREDGSQIDENVRIGSAQRHGQRGQGVRQPPAVDLAIGTEITSREQVVIVRLGKRFLERQAAARVQQVQLDEVDVLVNQGLAFRQVLDATGVLLVGG